MSVLLALGLFVFTVAPVEGAATVNQSAAVCQSADSVVLEPLIPVEPQEMSCQAPDCSGCPTGGGFLCDCNCQTTYYHCEAACDPMDFPCLFNCQQTANECIDCCYTWEGPWC